MGYENLEFFTETLWDIDADVVCLQEVHLSAGRSQADELARSLDLQGVFQSAASPSHIDARYSLGNAVLAKRPLRTARAVTLPRPHFPVMLPSGLPGQAAVIHDKLMQIVQLDGLTVANTHFFPLHILGSSWESKQGRELAETTAQLLAAELTAPLALCGDLNHPDVPDLVPGLMQTFRLVDVLPAEPSLPHTDARVDYILASAELAEGSRSEILPTFADHFPCAAVLRV